MADFLANLPGDACDLILKLITARGKVGSPINGFALANRGDKDGIILTQWNTDQLGAVPTESELIAQR